MMVNNVNKLYLIIFFHNLIPAYVIERLFWEQRGMTVLMVVLCEIIYAVSIIIFEIPTGVFADKIGRKTLLAFGAVLSVFEFIILLFAYEFWTFALVVFLAGISSACTSGAWNALLYDSLLTDKKQESFEKIVGRMNSLDFIASLLAALSGSVLAKYVGFEFNYIVSAASMFLGMVLTLLLKEPPRNRQQRKNEKSQSAFMVYVRKSITFYKTNPKVVTIITNAMGIAAFITYLDEFWQLYLDEIGFSVLFFGLFSACISLARIPGNLLAAYLLIYFKAQSIILFILGITTVCFFMTAIFPGVIGLSMIILIFLASGVIDPVVTGFLHHHGSSEIRATIESVQSLIESIITFTVGIGFGMISSSFSILSGFLFLGVISCLFFFYFLEKGFVKN
ncbi:MFS transporter [Neobacillus sp. 179-C4.2 HS]|uniref:MFS transporter n=1 Tax=Neobacillus driksii TaxID=3035913 RepID=A0ABV4YQ44_9BACI|nr:MFS transporter [Neobacillus sp. 179.-C4.2 HS]MDP5197804.1 MFS transporter [Neobacillus sp. 179.-C4.2 HS]